MLEKSHHQYLESDRLRSRYLLSKPSGLIGETEIGTVLITWKCSTECVPGTS